METQKELKNRTFYMESDLWMKFRQACLEQGVSASGQIYTLVKQWLDSKS